MVTTASFPPGALLSTETGLLRVATAGSVDDGKSTLIGRLLVDSKTAFEDQLASVTSASAARGDAHTDLALLTDGLRAEREQGITIDVAYRYIATPKRSFIIADTPGHVQYTRNMVTGASTAEVALVLVDARKGVVEQTRRHASLSVLLGLRHLVLVINKMDLVDFDETAFGRIVADFRDAVRAADAELGDGPEGTPTVVHAVPVSALDGDNVVTRSQHTPWFSGEPLLELLETIDPEALPTDAVERGAGAESVQAPARLPVQYVIRPRRVDGFDHRSYAGTVTGDAFTVGDRVRVLPGGQESTIESLWAPGGKALSTAVPGTAVSMALADEVDIARGDVLVSVANDRAARPEPTLSTEATVCWLDDRGSLTPGRRYLLLHETSEVHADVTALSSRIDVTTGERQDAAELALNDIGDVTLSLSAPLALARYRTNRTGGAFVLVDPATHATVAAGMVTTPGPSIIVARGAVGSAGTASASALGAASTAGAAGVDQASPHVTWHAGAVSAVDRPWGPGAVVWLTGLSGSGKSTVAVAVEQQLLAQGRAAYRLDGDNIRHGLTSDLGFSPEDRAENVRRTAEAAALIADAGVVALAALISPSAAQRARARAIAERVGVPFLEVFVDTPLEECEARDPKGLYAQARAGHLPGFTGVDPNAPYETPTDPDVTLRGRTLEEATVDVLAALEASGSAGPVSPTPQVPQE